MALFIVVLMWTNTKTERVSNVSFCENCMQPNPFFPLLYSVKRYVVVSQNALTAVHSITLRFFIMSLHVYNV